MQTHRSAKDARNNPHCCSSSLLPLTACLISLKVVFGTQSKHTSNPLQAICRASRTVSRSCLAQDWSIFACSWAQKSRLETGYNVIILWGYGWFDFLIFEDRDTRGYAACFALQATRLVEQPRLVVCKCEKLAGAMKQSNGSHDNFLYLDNKRMICYLLADLWSCVFGNHVVSTACDMWDKFDQKTWSETRAFEMTCGDTRRPHSDLLINLFISAS